MKTDLKSWRREMSKLSRGGGLFAFMTVKTVYYSARDFFLFLPQGVPSPVGDPNKDRHSGLYRGSHRLSVGKKPKFARLGLQPSYSIPGAAEAVAGLAPLKRPDQQVQATNDAGAGIRGRKRRSYAKILERGRHRQTFKTKSGKTVTRMAGSLQAPKGVHKVALSWLSTQKERVTALAKRDTVKEAARLFAASGGGGGATP